MKTDSSSLFTSSLSRNPTNGETLGADLIIVDEAFAFVEVFSEANSNPQLLKRFSPDTRIPCSTVDSEPTLSIASLSD